MTDEVTTMFTQFVEIAKEKPLKKPGDLVINKRYKIHRFSKPETNYRSILLESEDFSFFLPTQFKNIDLKEMSAADGYCFSIDKVLPTKGGLQTAKISFYKNNEKLNSLQ